MTENRTRSIIKAISWRIFATLTTIIIVYFFTKQLVLSLGVGFFEVISKLILYYIHERIWNRIYWGKGQKVKFTEQV